MEEIGVVGSFILICILLSIFTEHFAEVGNLLAVMRQASYYGMMAIGMVFVIAQGDIDLSVGSLYNLVTMTLAFACQNGMPVSLVIPLGLLMGAFFGFINGALSIMLKIPMIIVTLGTTTIFGGLSLVVGAGSSLSKFPKDNWFFNTLSGKLFGVIPASVVLMLVLGVIGYILFNHTSYGRYTCAIGANKQAAKFAGINIELYRLITMTFSGICCGIAGIGIFGFLKAADPSVGKGAEMMAISAAIIGGASLSGGAGSIIGALAGALIIAVIRNGMVLLGVNVYWQGVVTGATIILAVALDYIIKRRRGL
jgi:ribose transport system permease protein